MEPPYIPKPKVKKAARFDGETNEAVYKEHKNELETIVQKPGATWRNVEYYMWTEGYLKFKPSRIFTYTWKRIWERYVNL